MDSPLAPANTTLGFSLSLSAPPPTHLQCQPRSLAESIQEMTCRKPSTEETFGGSWLPLPLWGPDCGTAYRGSGVNAVKVRPGSKPPIWPCLEGWWCGRAIQCLWRGGLGCPPGCRFHQASPPGNSPPTKKNPHLFG